MSTFLAYDFGNVDGERWVCPVCGTPGSHESKAFQLARAASISRQHFPADAAIRDAWERAAPLTATNQRLFAAMSYLGITRQALVVALRQLGLLPGALPSCPECAGSLTYDFDREWLVCCRCGGPWRILTDAGGHHRLEPL